MRRITAAVITAAVAVSSLASAASAGPSPRPTATLLSSGTLTTEGGDEAYLEVEAVDVDGVISEIEVLWGDGSISFAHSYGCFMEPAPQPGDTHRFVVTNPYAEPGRYQVRYVVHSISGCTDAAVEQHSRVYVTSLVVP